MTERLFVYGTLRANVAGSMSHLLARQARRDGLARALGQLFDLGRYPGFVPSSQPDAWVHGELFTLDDPSKILPVLDAYEGCSPDDPHPHEFERVQLQVITETGERQLAWTYAYKGPTANKPVIASGDFARLSASQGSTEH